MIWSAPPDRRVVETVVAIFRDSAERSHQRLSALQYCDWVRSYHWLDASGMALYFLNQVETLGIEGALPAATLGRLRQNLADNRMRSSAMFAEFIAINQAFQQAGVQYCNLKGFTLSPDSCPDPVLRCQLDFDFLVDGHQLELCREILADTGYILTGTTNTVWEFKAGSSELVSIEDHYKPRPQRSVELHFTSSETPSRDERLDRLTLRSWDGLALPTLSASDQFVGQALHLFGHVCSACTRLAWFLEYKRHISVRYSDRPFWEEVRERSQTHRHASIAIGLATLLSTQLFGCEAPDQLNGWTLDRLPPAVRLWADHYGRKAILADFPGTKLYLLLLDELSRGDNSWQKKKRSSLLPLRRAPRIVHAGPEDNLRKRLGREVHQTRFILFRFRFHATQGLRYMIEAVRWKRRLTAFQKYAPSVAIERPRLSGIEKTSLDKG